MAALIETAYCGTIFLVLTRNVASTSVHAILPRVIRRGQRCTTKYVGIEVHLLLADALYLHTTIPMKHQCLQFNLKRVFQRLQGTFMTSQGHMNCGRFRAVLKSFLNRSRPTTLLNRNSKTWNCLISIDEHKLC
ncbi:unnamed protein product [Albugo candida]|uniref:Uncharacterized protein n=1 Tax=Albugo candida TaxID=65357 RepID=A0A024G0Q9_9STRA|nr:unnamed protein product [Albugo candida]|eukprot:CCI40255.1 unnamed protein product [Albugo candida]